MADKTTLSVDKFTLVKELELIEAEAAATLGSTMTVSPETTQEDGFISGTLKKADGTTVAIQIPFYLA